MERERLKTGKRRSWRAQEPGGYGRDEQPADRIRQALWRSQRASSFTSRKKREYPVGS